MCFLLALHIFNFSIDPRDPHPDNIPEDLSFNDIESITEFLTEVVFGWANVFEEHDEHDSNEGGALDFFKCYISEGSITATSTNTYHALDICKFRIRNSADISSITIDITSPPPKA
jgi:hypothetical protein